jgi:osmoprotectant transport system permease protein
VDAYSTDSELQQFNLQVLKDDKNFFPPYQGAPLMRNETAKKYPEIVQALDKLNGKITDEEMREMNYKVAVKGINAETVAKDFLISAGLINNKNK